MSCLWKFTSLTLRNDCIIQAGKAVNHLPLSIMLPIFAYNVFKAWVSWNAWKWGVHFAWSSLNPIGKCILLMSPRVGLLPLNYLSLLFLLFGRWRLILITYTWLTLIHDCLSMDYSLWLIVYGYAVWPMWLYGWVGLRPHSSAGLY